MNEEEKILEIAKGIGHKVGTYCNDEEIEVFEKFLEDYKYKSNLIEKQQEELETLKRDFEIVDHECSRLEKEDIKKDKLINILAEQLTTPLHSKEWVIDYYKREIEKC